MIHTIQTFTSSKPTIRVHSLLTKEFGFLPKIMISYGARIKEVWIEENDSLTLNQIELDEATSSSLMVDMNLEYEFSFQSPYLIIGPVIGMAFSKKEKYLIKNFDDYATYLLLYSQLHGAIFFFAEDQIDFQDKTITGYLYDPKTKELWRKTKMPFPAAIFRRSSLSNEVYKNLVSEIGNRIFNSYYFNKWEFWQWTHDKTSLISHLPETSNIITVANLKVFLEKFNGVYLKSITGSRGTEVYYITLSNGSFSLMDKNMDKGIQLTESDMGNFLKKRQDKYILQQPILTKTYKDRTVDYRIVLQKGRGAHWVCPAIIGRFGKKDGIASNYQKYGFARDVLESLQLQFNLTQKQAFQKKEAMISIATVFAKTLDEISGPYSDFGIDVAIDENGHIWVIEMNKRQDYTPIYTLKDKKVLFDVKTNPLVYAKEIAMKK